MTTSRQRRDPMDGLLVLDADGRDRVALGAPVTGPFVRGRFYPRNSPLAGLTFNDGAGNERGGVGVLDNGRAIVSIDRVGSEAIGMSAEAASGAATMTFTDAASRSLLTLQLTDSGPKVLVSDAAGRTRDLAQ